MSLPAYMPYVMSIDEPPRVSGNLLERIHGRLNYLLGQVINRRSIAQADQAILEECKNSEARAERYMWTDVTMLTGGQAIVREHGVIAIRWRTKFWPGPRHAQNQEGVIALGFHDEGDDRFDLYVAEQHGLPPTILARYGSGPGDYMSANPGLIGRHGVQRMGGPFPRALDLANELGWHWD